jgi:general secretion pathway protein C
VSVIVFFASTIMIVYIQYRFVDQIPASMDAFNTPRTTKRESPQFQEYRKVWERNLFSVIVDEEDRIEEVDLLSKLDQLSLTSLNCSLIGTIINEGGESWAIIKDNQSNAEEKYAVGSTIKNAKVVMILRNKVVLNIDGKDELLVMGIEKIRAEKKEEDATSGKTENVATYKVSKEFMQNSINNVGRLMSKVRVKPYFEKGKPAGFLLKRIKEGSILTTMGFKKGDIIQNVNGKNIFTTQDIMGLYGDLKESTLFSVGVLRDGKEMTLNFKVR